MYYFPIALTSVGALPSPLRAGARAAGRCIHPAAPGGFLHLTARREALAAVTEWGFSAGRSAGVRGAWGLTGQTPLQVTLCPISARSLLLAADLPAHRRVAPEHRLAVAGSGRGGGTGLRWVRLCYRAGSDARGHEISLSEPLLFAPPASFFFLSYFLVFFFSFYKRYFRGAAASSHPLPNSLLVTPGLLLIVLRNSPLFCI